MKIYTKTGDNGTSSLYDGSRRSKSDHIFDVMGENDELSARISMIIVFVEEKKDDKYESCIEMLRFIQGILQHINSNIATIDPLKKKKITKITEENIRDLETCIDEMENQLPCLKKFILPGITKTDTQVHLCRTQTRKCERMILRLEYQLDENILKFMNRLSDFFFVMARYICHSRGHIDTII